MTSRDDLYPADYRRLRENFKEECFRESLIDQKMRYQRCAELAWVGRLAPDDGSEDMTVLGMQSDSVALYIPITKRQLKGLLKDFDDQERWAKLRAKKEALTPRAA